LVVLTKDCDHEIFSGTVAPQFKKELP